jgi:hypothetical protein
MTNGTWTYYRYLVIWNRLAVTNPELRLYPGVDLDAGQISGRVEHAVSGDASEFRSVDDLIDFIRRLLAKTKQ